MFKRYFREINKQASLELADDLKPCAVLDLLNQVLATEGYKIKTNGFSAVGVLVKIVKETARI